MPRWLDPMVRLILAAFALALVLPVSGALRPVAQTVSNAAVFTLFLLYGLRLSRTEVRAGLANARVLGPLALWIFGAMAAAGWLVSHALGMAGLPAMLALGFLYLGVLPSTVQAAPTYSSLAGGDVALSVIAAALSNIIGVVVSGPLFSALAGTVSSGFEGGTLVKVFSLLLLPFVIGQATQRWGGGWVRANKRVVTWVERTAIGIAVYVAASGAVAERMLARFPGHAWLLVGGGIAAMLAIGYGGAWLLGGALRMSRAERISFLFAGAQKSAAMGAPLATVLFPPALAGVIILPLLGYHLCQMLAAAPLAARLRAGQPAGLG